MCSRKARKKCLNHITDWFCFRCCCLRFSKNNQGSGEKTYLSTARSRMCLMNSRPLPAIFPEKLNPGRPFIFGVAELSKFAGIILHRNTNRKGQRTQHKIRFAFCRTQLFHAGLTVRER